MSLTTHHEQRIVPWTTRQMFDLVADVEKYPQFLPWCLAVRIVHRDVNAFEADVVAGFSLMRERFSTLVKLHGEERIETFYTKGPFRYLHNVWKFVPLEDGGCLVDFHIEFELKSPLVQGLLGSVFHEVSRRMVSAFEARARDLYGKKG